MWQEFLQISDENDKDRPANWHATVPSRSALAQWRGVRLPDKAPLGVLLRLHRANDLDEAWSSRKGL